MEGTKQEKDPQIEDDDEDDDDVLTKLDDNIKKEYLLGIHNELRQINHGELNASSKIVRDKKGNIIDQLHKTVPFLTKYEKAKILGLRAKQINNGSHIFVSLSKDVIDGYLIAELELQQRKIPFIIQRPMPNGGSEFWKVSDLEII